MAVIFEQPKNPVSGLEPIYVTLHFQDDTCKNAQVQFFDRKDAHKPNHIEGTETFAFVGMPDCSFIYSGYLR